MRSYAALLLGLFCTAAALADGPKDNLADDVRPVPPPGVELSANDKAELSLGVALLAKEIADLRPWLKAKPALLASLPDVEIFHKAVHDALEYNEFFNLKEVDAARKLLKIGQERAAALRDGKAPWNSATGLVPRGYVSKIDGSIQPYGLVVPSSYTADSTAKFRLDVWCHGRGETLSELSFVNGRLSSAGEFTPPGSIVVHLYGRYCNANKLAGEIDCFEAIDDIKQHYPIDENRQVIRGFSMGGAACWQFAVHYPSFWAAAAPGAGFSETADFLKVFQHETVQPSWYEKKLWHVYDCTDYAVNLFNLPTVAYSGDKDSQKQAADMMAKALEAEGIQMEHVIGKDAGHKYTPEAKVEINRRIDSIVELGRDPVPPTVRFTTWTLRYNRSFWVTVDGMGEHWQRARVDAELTAGKDGGPRLKTENVTALTLDLPAGRCPLDITKRPYIEIDGTTLDAPQPKSDRSWLVHLRKQNGKWQVAAADDDGTALQKRHGLQGPIDDAFLDSFLMVRPTGQPLNEKVAAWTSAEMGHAAEHWRRQFRGVARIKDDKDVSEADIAAHNLILWGDPSSNAVIKKILDKLPIQWNSDNVKLGDRKYAAGNHMPALVYPNPLNPRKYVVLNSGFTFREYDYLNNARQVPKLPDFAVIDIDVPRSSHGPGGIAEAGFFGEQWQLLPLVK